MFTADDYRTISNIVFNSEMPYPGYRPNVVESPNGDGYWDGDKRYAHVAEKYFKDYRTVLYDTVAQRTGFENFKSMDDNSKLSVLTTPKYTEAVTTLQKYLTEANNKAIEVAIELGVPKEFWPDAHYGALRILEYPPGAITHPHKDFDLFTLMCYRNTPENFHYIMEGDEEDPRTYRSDGTYDKHLIKAQELNHQIHFGEILELIIPDYKANMHEVSADPFGRTQYSIVYFSIPNHAAVLPNGQTVGQWLDERLARSRKEVEAK